MFNYTEFKMFNLPYKRKKKTTTKSKLPPLRKQKYKKCKIT